METISAVGERLACGEALLGGVRTWLAAGQTSRIRRCIIDGEKMLCIMGRRFSSVVTSPLFTGRRLTLTFDH